MNKAFGPMFENAFSAATAWAQAEETPRHGGVVQRSGDTRFELVTASDDAEIYLEDEGAAVSAANVSGKLTVMRGIARLEALLEPVGGRLVAKGVRLARGEKVIAVVALPGKTASARFLVK